MSFVKEVQSTEVAEDVAYLQSSGAGAFLEELAAAVVAEKPEDPLEGLICIAQRIKERAPVVQFVPHSPAPPPPRQDSRQSQGSTEKEPPADTTSRQRESVISVQSEESCSVFGSTDLAAQRKIDSGPDLSVGADGTLDLNVSGAPEVGVGRSDSKTDSCIACSLDASVSGPSHVKEITVVVVAKDDVGNKTINQYAVVNELGRGQYGKVKLVFHNPTQKYYAIKIMNKSVLSKARKGASGDNAGKLGGKTALDSALQEIAIMKRLDHPNVCKLYEVINDPTADKMYLILEYLEEGPIYVLKEGCKPIALEMLPSLFVGICQGLDYLHQVGIIHRDIKPENILLDKTGCPKLTDFGVSNEDAGQKQVSDTSGTPAFFPPELFSGKMITGRSCDVWALGVTFYILSYANTPFGGRNIPEICESVTNTTPVFNEAPSADLADLLKQMLLPSHDDRLGVKTGVDEVLAHKFLHGTEGAEKKIFQRIELTQEEKSKAVITGKNIQLKLMNTVGAMMKIKAKFGKGPNRPIPGSISEVNNGDDQAGLSTRLSANHFRRNNSSGGADETQSLKSRKSFKTEEEVTMESHTEGELESEINKALSEEWEDLTLSCYKFDSFPDKLYQCGGLVNLTAHLNGLKELSPKIDYFQMLVSLNLGQNELVTLPQEIGFLSSLEILDVNRNQIVSLPDTINNLTELKYINLDFNNLEEIPECLCELVDLERCFLIENEKIKTFPREAMEQWADCKLAVDNAPILKQEWGEIEGSLPNVKLMWHKLYPDQVNDYLFVGSLRTVQSEKVIRELDIRRIVTAGKGLEILDPLPEGVEQLALNVDDIPEQSMMPVFDEVIAFIDEAKAASQRIIVHCFAGLSRSVTFVCAYLMKRYNMTFKESITKVKQARPNSNPNDGFRKQLILYEKLLHGTQIDPDDPECRAGLTIE